MQQTPMHIWYTYGSTASNVYMTSHGVVLKRRTQLKQAGSYCVT